MQKNTLNWFDKMMIGITFAEANAEMPDLSRVSKCGDKKQCNSQAKDCASFDGQAVRVR